MDRRRVVRLVRAWYRANARDLPWRAPGTTPWGVMVSEFMLQQTPVSRVIGPYLAWLERWPTPAALSTEAPGEAVRAWGRLGYPRRALRLHQCAVAIVADHAGRVPDDLAALRALPGVGDYTAAAIASFAFGRRHVVLDTNVRRVLARLDAGQAQPAPTLTAAERRRAEAWLPDAEAEAADWAVASMELGAQVCTAAAPRCDACPVSAHCAWLAAGRPAWTGPTRPTQPYEGTDRQCRGALLGLLRERGEIATGDLLAAWPDADQAGRALRGLVEDGLVQAVGDRYML